MNTKKNTKKTVKPTIVVDLTKCTTPEDVQMAFINAKIKHVLTKSEFEIFLNNLAERAGDVIGMIVAGMFGDYNTIHFDGEKFINMNLISYDIEDGEKFECDAKGNASIKKPNAIKRFWNWITRKK